MMRLYLLAMLFFLGASCSAASDGVCPKDGEWSAGCFATVAGVRQVKPHYLQNIVGWKSGAALIVIEDPHELVAVNRRGVVVVPGIFHSGDFDYPSAPQGVGRFHAAGKCGFVDTTTFKILVPAEYDHCQAVRDREAIACKDCVRYCTEDECQDDRLVGGRGFAFDTRGRLLRQFAPPDLESACGRAGVAEVVKLNKGYPRLKCRAAPDAPFKL